MNWELLIVPLIALGVWILTSIFRGAEEAKDQPRQPAPGATPPSRPASELDRFLEEARRRRDKAQAPPAPEEVPLAMPVAVLPPVAPPPRPEPKPRKREPQVTSSPRKREPAPASSSRATNEPLMARIEDRPSFVNPASAQANPMMALPTNMETPSLPTLPSPTMNTPATANDQSRRDASPLRAALSSMLRDRKSLATAFILHEILDKPLCMRREGKAGGQD